MEGPPDLAIEIVSPESEARDWRDKYLVYQQSGVREYWVIDPMSEHAEFYTLDADGQFDRIPEVDGWLVSAAVTGFRLKVEWLWPATQPGVLIALAELGVR